MSTPSPPTTESTSTATPISTKEISDLKQKFNVDTTELKNLNDGNTYKKDSVQKNISLETQHYELGLSESTQIQEQLNFCQDVQLEYIKKHEELKTVFALALNLFQFYTYTLEIIDSLLKIQTPEQKPGYFTERNVILTETKRNIEIDLISNYQPTKDAGGNITDIISVEEDTSIGISNDRQLGDDEFSNVFSAYTLTINNTGIKNDSENKFKKDNLKITATTINDNFKLTINKNGNAILSKNDINRNLELRLEITIEKSDGTQIKIFVNIYFISDLDITPNPSSAPPTTILSTPPPAGTPPAETGGKVYFNRIKDDTFGQLKKHQVELRKKLKGLNDLIAPPTITNLKLGGKEINIPLLNNAASGGGAIKSIVESKSSKQKKSKKEPFEISKVINQLIGGTPVDIPFFYTGEIVQKKLVNNSKYYFLELLQKSGSSSKSLLPSTLNANIKKKNISI